jgi:ubiquitin-protein ligase E3 C
VSLLLVLAALMNTHLNALDDHEFYAQSKPLPLPHILTLVKAYKVLLFKTIEFDATIGKEKGQVTTTERDTHEGVIGGSGHFGEHASRILGAVLTDLYTRWNRRPFAQPELWTVRTIEDDITRYRTMMRAEGHVRDSLAYTLLHVMPWAWDLLERIKLFRDIIDSERSSIQQATHENGTLRNRSILCQIRRKYLLADGLKQLEGVTGANLKLRVQIQYVNEFGEKEAGIDIGGLFKDFVTDLSGLIFNPNYGLFCSTEGGLIYPNPQAKQLYEEGELEKLYSFLGRVLGKALYENITPITPRFAPFFLNFMHSKYNFQNMVQDLRSLDPELYKNLMFLKSYTGDVGDLCLTFAVDDTSALGGNRSEVELFAGGGKVYVTSANRLKYINLVAKYYLHDRIKFQSGAFFHGLYQVISPALLGMFGAPELQVLVSGGVRAISSDDLKSYAHYNGYFSGDAYMRRFWVVFEGLDAEDKGRLIKFVTSCERPPILGFSDLQPPFTIQRVDCSDDSRLPTASTCFNILKLPTYSSQRVLLAKLLQAIRSESGFDLS